MRIIGIAKFLSAVPIVGINAPYIQRVNQEITY